MQEKKKETTKKKKQNSEFYMAFTCTMLAMESKNE